MRSIVIVSYNRRGALASTLRSLGSLRLLDSWEVIVVDNGSGDGSAEVVRTEFPGVRLIECGSNTGVAAFNTGVAAASGGVVLVLDDDACPEPGGLAGALEALESDPAVGGVALAPCHPTTGGREWPFATAASDRFPLMGCANLVRREAWLRVGGYEESYFLYRNDTDLALKMLAAGYRVRYDPTWTAWHDSPAARRKSERWLELATRNWVWLCRRHGRGAWTALGVLAGAARAAAHAGWRPSRLWRVARGMWAGLTRRPATLPGCCCPGALEALLRLRGGRGG